MEKFITEQDKELLPWLHCNPIVKTIEQSLISSIKLSFARESLKLKLEAIATATTTGVFNEEVKYIEKKILTLMKDHDDAPATITLIKKTLLKLEKIKLQNKERDIITKRDLIKAELETTLETLIARRHPDYHHPKGVWTDDDSDAYLRFTSAYWDIITASYDHRQLLHRQKKQLKKLAFEKKQEDDNALLQLTRKDLNQTIAASIKALSKSLTNKSSSTNSRKSKNGHRPAQQAGLNTKRVAQSANKNKTETGTKQNKKGKEGKHSASIRKRNAGGAIRK
jgi:hypothetical protein